jgi:CBS domain-containing membrane protein
MSELLEIKVHQAMTKQVIAASTSNTFSQIVAFFSQQNYNHCPVLENGKLVGILSVKDVLRAIYTHSISVGKSVDASTLNSLIIVSDLMVKNPITVGPDSTLAEAKKLLSKYEFQALPVVENDVLVGIITTKDLVRLKILKIDGSDYNPI